MRLKRTEQQMHKEKEERLKRRLAKIPYTDMLDTVQAAMYINMSKSWLEKGRMNKREKLDSQRKYCPTPKYVTLPNGYIRYMKSDLEEWKRIYGKRMDDVL